MTRQIQRFQRTCVALIILVVIASGSLAESADWPMFGRDQSRNAVSPEQIAPPTDWDVGKQNRKTGEWERSRNIKWSAPLGNHAFGDPIVADEQLWVGINNWRPEFAHEGDSSVLAGFAAGNGKSLFRYVSPRLPQGRMFDWPSAAIACSPLVQGERMWFVTNRCEVLCLDLEPLKKGQGPPQEMWKVDLIKDFGVIPCGSLMSLCHTCSIASHADLIYVITGNGVGDGFLNVAAPDAPSLICFDKRTGALVWQDKSPAANILNGQWASPLVIEQGDTAQVIAPQGDGWLRSFDALTGKLIWKFDINFKTAKWVLGGGGTRNNILATPVLYGGRVYVASGDYAEHGEGPGRLVCLDPTKTGDISSELAVDSEGKLLPHRRIQAVIPEDGEQTVPNPNSGLVWEYVKSDRNGDGKIDFEEQMHRAYANVAIKNDLLVIGDFSGLTHFINAKTGKVHWTHDGFAAIYASPLIVGDKVFLADED